VNLINYTSSPNHIKLSFSFSPKGKCQHNANQSWKLSSQSSMSHQEPIHQKLLMKKENKYENNKGIRKRKRKEKEKETRNKKQEIIHKK